MIDKKQELNSEQHNKEQEVFKNLEIKPKDIIFAKNKHMIYLDETFIDNKKNYTFTSETKCTIKALNGCDVVLEPNVEYYLFCSDVDIKKFKENNPTLTVYSKIPTKYNSEKGVKHNQGKTDYSEIDWEFIEQLAQRMNQNKGKYEKNNFKKPMDVDLLKQSLLRHTIEILKGNYEDEGREHGHLESASLNLQFINYQLKNHK